MTEPKNCTFTLTVTTKSYCEITGWIAISFYFNWLLLICLKKSQFMLFARVETQHHVS